MAWHKRRRKPRVITTRMVEVLAYLILAGMSRKEVAQELGVTLNTIHTHVFEALLILEVTTTIEAGIKLGWIRP